MPAMFDPFSDECRFEIAFVDGRLWDCHASSLRKGCAFLFRQCSIVFRIALCGSVPRDYSMGEGFVFKPCSAVYLTNIELEGLRSRCRWPTLAARWTGQRVISLEWLGSSGPVNDKKTLNGNCSWKTIILSKSLCFLDFCNCGWNSLTTKWLSLIPLKIKFLITTITIINFWMHPSGQDIFLDYHSAISAIHLHSRLLDLSKGTE